MSNGSLLESDFGTMSDSQLRQTITQLSTAANKPDQFRPYSPAPQDGKAKSEHKELSICDIDQIYFYN